VSTLSFLPALYAAWFCVPAASADSSLEVSGLITQNA